MTAPTVDLDDLKRAWQRLDTRLARQHALAFEQFKERRVHRARRHLWPLYAGQSLQVVIGLALVVMAVRTWLPHWDHVPLRVAGLIVHVYGLGVVVAGARSVALAARIDYASPVLGIQRQLAELREWYVRSGTAIGLAWWLMWMPFMMMLLSFAGVDMWTRAPGLFRIGVPLGVVGLLLTWAFDRWSRRPRWAWIAAASDEAMAGSSLRRARAVLDEIRRFEDEDAPPAA